MAKSEVAEKYRDMGRDHLIEHLKEVMNRQDNEFLVYLASAVELMEQEQQVPNLRICEDL